MSKMEDKYSALTAETLLMMLNDLCGTSRMPYDETVKEIQQVEAELSRRCRGGMPSLIALMGYLVENSEITYERGVT